MDIVTHVLVAYAIGLLAWAMLQGTVRGGARWGVISATAALAPDLDVLVAPFAQIDALYAMQHRGASHSLLGAPITAWLVIRLLAAGRRRWPRLQVYEWRRAYWPLIIAGAYSHVMLDAITHHGVPLLWPWTPTPFSLEIYFWIIWWLAPVSLLPLVLRFRGRIDDRAMVKSATIVLAIIVVVGAMRVAARPDGDAYATADPLDWIVSTTMPNETIRVDMVRQGIVRDTAWYEPNHPPDAAAAIAAMQGTIAYRDFTMGSIGPIIIQAQPTPSGWNLSAQDVVVRFEARHAPGWLPPESLDRMGVLQATASQDGLRIRPS